jgi:hypothetical protein
MTATWEAPGNKATQEAFKLKYAPNVNEFFITLKTLFF